MTSQASQYDAPLTQGQNDYWQVYGLQDDPFANKVDSAMYYALPQFEQYLDLLQHLYRTSNTLLTVTGVTGSGKTTLLQQFLLETLQDDAVLNDVEDVKLSPGAFRVFQDEAVRICQLNGDTSIDPVRLLDVIVESFDLPWQGMEVLDEQFEAQIENLQRCRQTCLLIIDNAHHLPLETLRYLLYMISLQSDVQMRFHVMLFGGMELKQHLQDLAEEQFKGDMICILELEPLNREEVEQYLQQRLLAAGLRDLTPFSKNEINTIYRTSQGIPGEINRIAQFTLLKSLNNESPSLIQNWFDRHLTKMLGGLLLLIALTVTVITLNKVDQSSVTQTAAASNPVQPGPLNAQASLPITAVSQPEGVNPIAAAADNSSTANQTTRLDSQVVANNPSQSGQPLTDGQQSIVATNPTVADASPAPVITSTPSTTPVDKTAGVETYANNMIIVEPQQSPNNIVTVEPTQAPTKSIASDQQIVKAETKIAALEKPAVIKQKLAKVKKPLLAKQAVDKNTHKVIAKTNGAKYTLQLMALSNQNDLQKIIDKHHLKNKAQTFHIKDHGKDRYILTYGKYENRKQASAAVEKLPKDLQTSKPWIRSIASVQQVAVKTSG